MKRRLRLTGVALVFSIWLAAAIASPAQTFSTLLSFDRSNGGIPVAGLVQGRNGRLYGTTELFLHQDGMVFDLTQTGKLARLHVFDGNDGGFPEAGLVLATDGNFYGTTFGGGGTVTFGTVFEITPAGNLTLLYKFCSKPNCTDGEFPLAGLIQGTDGNFYGTTELGGVEGVGTVFRITPRGALTVLHSFCSEPNCADGVEPGSGLVQATDGNFYGATAYTVFRIAPTGKLTTLHTFDKSVLFSMGGLVQAADGYLYGTTPNGGKIGGSCSDLGCGTVFRITLSGRLTTLHRFGWSDGAYPRTGLVEATDGNFYGTTSSGGAHVSGTVFKITRTGKLTAIHNFCSKGHCRDGNSPAAALVQGTDGSFYGTTPLGGGSRKCSGRGCGIVFSLSMGLGPFVAFVRSSGEVGATSEILSQGLTGTSGVSFNGTAAKFVVHSDTYLTATVPQGATTGPVTVTTPSGTLTSNVPFRVRQ
jgi:uncharacterized repeat protein (TIGR03803 family)